MEAIRGLIILPNHCLLIMKDQTLLFKAAFLFFFACLFNLSSSAQTIKRVDGTSITADSLQKAIQSLMTKAKVAGLELAVFNKNKIVYKKAFGTKNSVTSEALKTSTNMYGASLSKAVFAVLVMKLVEDGVLNLDKPLQEYLTKPIYEYTPQKRWHDDY